MQWSITRGRSWNGISICYSLEDIQDLNVQMLLISIIEIVTTCLSDSFDLQFFSNALVEVGMVSLSVIVLKIFKI